jgi:hypothetical protein
VESSQARQRGIAVDDDQAGAVGAGRGAQFIAAGQCHDQEHRVLEADARVGNQPAVGLEGGTEGLAPLHAGQGARGIGHLAERHHAEQVTDAGQHRRFLAHLGRAHEIAGLLRRLAAMAHRRLAVQQETAIELADAIVTEAGPRTDGARARLVLDETQREVVALAVAVVAVFLDAHR